MKNDIFLTVPDANVMTIDVEDWYNSSLDLFEDSDVAHGTKPDSSVVDNTLSSLDLLDKTNSKSTYFILGTVAEHYPDLIKEIKSRGHEIASHGYAHNLVYTQTPQQFEDDVKISLEHLANAGCTDVIGYRAPYWSITKKSLWALDILKKLGFKYDSSIFPIKRGLYGIPDANPKSHQLDNGIWEFPPLTVRKLGINWPIAGGGYLRLVPYWILGYAIKKSAGSGCNVFYFHPYELDPEDIEVKHKLRSLKSFIYAFQQKLGRSGNPVKLKRLITEYQFTSFKEILPD